MPTCTLTGDQIANILGDSWEMSSLTQYIQSIPGQQNIYSLAYDPATLARVFPDRGDGQRQSLEHLLALAATTPDPGSVAPVSAASVTETISAAPVSVLSISASSDAPIVSATPALTPASIPVSFTATDVTPAPTLIVSSAPAVSSADPVTLVVASSGFDLTAELTNSIMSTRDSITELMKIKNPISWLLQIKKIKDDIALMLEDLADRLNSQFETENTKTEMGFLTDLGFWRAQHISNEEVASMLSDNGAFSRKRLHRADSLSTELIENDIRAKVTEESWLEQRINYRVRLRNDLTKQKVYQTMEQYNQFRRIILRIQDSAFSDVIKPFVYEFLTERLALDLRSYRYLKYFLLFVLPKSYREYSMTYTFFLEYEGFKSGKKLRFFFFVALIQLLMIAAIGWYYSAIFALGIVVYYIGAYIKRTTFTSLRPMLRLHVGFQSLGILIIAGYTLLLLNSNGYIVIDPKLSVLSRPQVRSVVYYTLHDVPYETLTVREQAMMADVLGAYRTGSGSVSTQCSK